MQDKTNAEKHQKAILRFLDGRVLKGFITAFTLADDHVFIEDETASTQKVRLRDLKAIFFVKDFGGDRHYRERKTFSGPRREATRVFLRFKDGEQMMGYLDGDVPGDKGFFLGPRKETGFFFRPVDGGSNNDRVFVVASALQDMTRIG